MWSAILSFLKDLMSKESLKEGTKEGIKKGISEGAKQAGTKAVTEAGKDSLLKAFGEQALNTALQGINTQQPNAGVRQPLSINPFGVNSAEATSIPEIPQRYKRMVVSGPGGYPITGQGEALPSSIPAQYQQYAQKPSPSMWSRLGKAGMEFGRGGIEGILGMPQTGKSIPYYLGKLPGDVERTRVGMPTAGEVARRHQLMKEKPIAETTSKVYKTEKDIPDEIGGLPLRSITPVAGGFKASYGKQTDLVAAIKEELGLGEDMELTKPPQVKQEDWDMATDEQKEELLRAMGLR